MQDYYMLIVDSMSSAACPSRDRGAVVIGWSIRLAMDTGRRPDREGKRHECATARGNWSWASVSCKSVRKEALANRAASYRCRWIRCAGNTRGR